MIIKLLGLLDILTGLSFWILGVFHLNFLSSLVLTLGLLILTKGIIFTVSLDAISVLDVACGIVIITESAINLPIAIVIIVSLFLLQKGIFSMLG